MVFNDVVSHNSNWPLCAHSFWQVIAMTTDAGWGEALPFCSDESACFSSDLRRRLA